MASVRQPVVDIYTALKSHYNTHTYSSHQVYARMTLNKSEMQKIGQSQSVNSLMYFRSFIEGQPYELTKEQTPNQVDFVLHLPASCKNRSCTGFYINQKRKSAIINIGTYFSIKAVDYQQKQHKKVHLQLVLMPRK